MSTIVYRISLLLGSIVADVPVGTNLGLFWLLWALLAGRFLLSRGAVVPALADGGLAADAVRRSGAALARMGAGPSRPSCGRGSPFAAAFEPVSLWPCRSPSRRSRRAGS